MIKFYWLKYLCLEAGDLFSKISSVTYQLTEEKCKKFVLEITKALKYIHDRNIIHLDLKPANIMMKNKTEYFKVNIDIYGMGHLVYFCHI